MEGDRTSREHSARADAVQARAHIELTGRARMAFGLGMSTGSGQDPAARALALGSVAVCMLLSFERPALLAGGSPVHPGATDSGALAPPHGP